MGEQIDNLRDISVFNTPLELGLRALFISDKVYPNGCDLQRLVIYDYLLLHSSDLKGGPNSIHPSIPHRSSEIFVKREILKKGLLIMQSRELVKIEFAYDGILYKSSKLLRPFLSYYDSHYAKSLNEVSSWVVSNFTDLTDEQLNIFINENLEKWGGEFTKEALMRGGLNE